MNKGEAITIEPAKNGYIVYQSPRDIGVAQDPPMVFEKLEHLKAWLEIHFEPGVENSNHQKIQYSGFRELSGKEISSLDHKEMGVIDGGCKFVETEPKEQPESVMEAKIRKENDEWERHVGFK